MEESASPPYNHGAHNRNASSNSFKENADPNDFIIEDVTDTGYDADVEVIRPTPDENGVIHDEDDTLEGSSDDTPQASLPHDRLAEQFQKLQFGQPAGNIEIYEDAPEPHGRKRTWSDASTEVLDVADQYATGSIKVAYSAGVRRGAKKPRHFFTQPGDDFEVALAPKPHPNMAKPYHPTYQPARHQSTKEQKSRIPLGSLEEDMDDGSGYYYIYDSDGAAEADWGDIEMADVGDIDDKGDADISGAGEAWDLGRYLTSIGQVMDIE